MSGNTAVQYFPLSTPLFEVIYTTLVTRSDAGRDWLATSCCSRSHNNRDTSGMWGDEERSLNRSLTISCCRIRIHTYTVHEHSVILPAPKFARAVEGYRKW